MLIRSVACIRLEIRDKIFVGCGRGWEQDISKFPAEPLVCEKCGRDIFVTGTYMVINLKEI